MAKNIIIDENGNQVLPTDYKAKRERIEKQLDERVFSKIAEDDMWEIKVDKYGNETKKKRKVQKGEIAPTVTTSRVQAELESILILEEMLDAHELDSIEPKAYFEAYSEYCQLVAYINKYVPFRANKQSYCGFVGILNDDFEEKLSDQVYGRTFKRIRDSFAGGSFIDASSGLYDSRAIINESQTKGDGLNMIKNPEFISFTANTTINQAKYDALAERLQEAIGRSKAQLPKPKKEKK